MIDYSVLPPEINSARMYAGPGAGPMLDAGGAWSGLAAELRSAAASYNSIVSGLSGSNWRGAASASMAAAAAPYVAWMNTTATQVEQTAAQAQAAVSAYESAFSMIVPPAAIAANRAHLIALIADNVLGRNAPAIAATEARYGDMWAQDAAAMYGYTNSSAAASQLTPFSPPPQATTGNASAGQAAALAEAVSASAGANTTTAGASTTPGLPSWLDSITASGSNTSTTGLAGLLNALDGSNGSLLGSFLNNATVANFSNGFTTSGLTNPTLLLDAITGFSYLFPGVGGAGLSSSVSGLAAGLSTGTGTLGSAGLGAAVSAGVGQAAPLGVLSVPPGWAAVAPAFGEIARKLPGANALSPALGATPLASPVITGIPSAGLAGLTDHDLDEPLYGFRPIVMSRSPAAG